MNKPRRLTTDPEQRIVFAVRGAISSLAKMPSPDKVVTMFREGDRLDDLEKACAWLTEFADARAEAQDGA